MTRDSPVVIHSQVSKISTTTELLMSTQQSEAPHKSRCTWAPVEQLGGLVKHHVSGLHHQVVLIVLIQWRRHIEKEGVKAMVVMYEYSCQPDR